MTNDSLFAKILSNTVMGTSKRFLFRQRAAGWCEAVGKVRPNTSRSGLPESGITVIYPSAQFGEQLRSLTSKNSEEISIDISNYFWDDREWGCRRSVCWDV